MKCRLQKTRKSIQEENWKIHKYVEIKQKTIEQPWGKEEIKIKLEKTTLAQIKMKHNISKLLDVAKAVLKGKLIVINAYTKK